MQTKYYKWFDIEIIHDYFVDGICKKVTLVPFSETAVLFSTHQILLRKHENIISFYVGVNESESGTFGEKLESLGEFYFQLITEDTFFHHYTEVPQLQVDQIFLFQNEAGRSRLHVNNTITNEDIVNWAPFRESHSLSNTALDNRRIGIIKMHATSVGALQPKPPTYRIQLTSRAVHFIYKVAVEQRQNLQLSPKQVSFPSESTPNFSGPVSIELTGSKLAHAFTSNDPIKLQEQLTEHPLLNYTYQDPTASTGVGSDEIKLPNPSPEYLESFIDANGNKKLSTSTIVYI